MIGDEDNDFNPEDRLRDFPALEYQDFQVDGVSAWESACDVVLSSAGWISCNPGVAQVSTVIWSLMSLHNVQDRLFCWTNGGLQFESMDS